MELASYETVRGRRIGEDSLAVFEEAMMTVLRYARVSARLTGRRCMSGGGESVDEQKTGELHRCANQYVPTDKKTLD